MGLFFLDLINSFLLRLLLLLLRSIVLNASVPIPMKGSFALNNDDRDERNAFVDDRDERNAFSSRSFLGSSRTRMESRSFSASSSSTHSLSQGV